MTDPNHLMIDGKDVGHFVDYIRSNPGSLAVDVKAAFDVLWITANQTQAATLAVPHTGMAVITDIGNVADIHPRNKQEVGRRLALWSLAHDYGKKDLVFSGPLYDSMSVELETVRLKFKHSAGGLASRRRDRGT